MMRIRSLFPAFAAFFFLFLLFILYLSSVLDRSANHENKHVQININKLERFKHLGKIDNMMAIRFNNYSKKTARNPVDFVCASELFVTECPNPGLAAMLLKTLDHINFCGKIGAKPTVYWRLCESVCPSDPTINAWEMFFEPINPKIEAKAKVVLCLGSPVGPSRFWFGKLNIEKPNLTVLKALPKEDLEPLSFRQRTLSGFMGVITRDIQIKTNHVIQNYVKVLPKIQTIVDRFYSNHLSKFNVVAVHVRGTDHGLETDEGRLAPLSTYIQNIRNFLDNNPSVNRIFIAGDNQESITTFVKEFGSKLKVVYTKAIRAKAYNGPPVHGSGVDAYKLGSEVLVDILVMAKCKHFFHVESSVAALVTYFNPYIESYFVEHKLNNDSKSVFNTANSNADKFKSEEKEREEDKDQEQKYKCFLQNRRYSVCPNFHKGVLIRYKDMMAMRPR